MYTIHLSAPLQKKALHVAALSAAFTLCVSVLTLSLAEDEIVLDDSAFEYSIGFVDLDDEPQASQSIPFVTLQRGSKGEAVKQVQTRLAELGFYGGMISGDFLDGTDAATRAFQKKNKLAANGKVTPTTWNAMMHPEAVGKDGRTQRPQGWEPDYQEEIREEDADPHAGEAATPVPATAFVYTRKLEYGSKGDDVRLLQQRLQDLGYFPDATKISGNYYTQTRNAVRAFQRNNGLKADGIAGTETQNTLWDDTRALDSASAPRPAPTPAPLPYALKVDVTNQVTSAYGLDETGEHTLLIRQMICSTGTKSNPTPLKTTQSKGSRARWGYFPEWGSHAQYLVRIDSKNAFHSVLYSSPDPMKLVVGAYNALGSRASHGCVRLLVADAKWIYDNCPSGTTITVYAGEPDPELTQMLKPPPLNRKTMLPQATPEPTAPPAWDPAAPAPPYRVMKKGAKGADVWWLQTKLASLGYYNGTISGGYCEGTTAAVKAFQKDTGLTADGIAGPITLKELYENPAHAQHIVPLTQTNETPGDQWIPMPEADSTQDGVWLTPPPPPGTEPEPTPIPIGGGVG